MREFIASRLAEMKDTSSRAILKDAISDIFLPLYDEIEAKYTALENRIRDELPLIYAAYTVYSTVMPRDSIDGSHSYLYAMLPEDMTECKLSVKQLNEGLRSGKQVLLETVFIEADLHMIRRIVIDKEKFDGTFIIGSERFSFKFILVPTKRYYKRIEALYYAFLSNDVPWVTVNSAYLSKFFDVCLISMDDMPATAIIQSVELCQSTYMNYLHRGMIPVWNVEYHSIKGEAFPEPAGDSVNYEYQFDVCKYGADNGILIDYCNDFILGTRREQNTITIVSAQQKGFTWNLYCLRQKHDSSVDIYKYPVISNARVDAFSTRLMNRFGTHITTKAEMRKLMTSFEACEYNELVDISFTEERPAYDTYNMNPFIVNEVRHPDYQKTLILTFKATKRESFLSYDIMSFLVSEFQNSYPEYNCIGALL